MRPGVVITMVFVFLSVNLFFYLEPPADGVRGKVVARVSSLQGDVRIRRVGAVNWAPVTGNILVRIGDRLFAGPKGSLTIVFRGQSQARLTMSEGCVFNVTGHLPINTRVGRRSMGSGNSQMSTVLTDAELPGFSLPDRGSDPRVDTRDMQGRSLTQGSESLMATGMMLEWRISELPVTFPLEDHVRIRASSFPGSFSVIIESQGRRPIAALWRVSNLESSMWTSRNEGVFEDIPIPEPGEYAFQAFLDDGLLRTKRIYVTAELIHAGERILPVVLNRKEIIVLP